MRESSLSLLYPPFANTITIAVIRCQQAGIRLHPFETYRDPHRQDELFAQGRDNGLPRVTNARAWKSWHQYGLAVDFAFKEPDGRWHWDGDVAGAVAIVKDLGLVWGGPKDQLHFEHPSTQKITLSIAESICRTTGELALWRKILRENL